ncbi:MAG TPA: aldo/keto reductase [Steroidobacteraceae bacterium]|nr:aldo/keto reductase [Steroidobacteraceae bacterium]
MTDLLPRCSRRSVLQGGLAAAVATLLPGALRTADSAEDPRIGAAIERRIPSSGQRVAVMGLGTNDFGRAGYDRVRAVLDRLHATGGNMIDTAASYGDSEMLIGRALTELRIRDQMFLATKFNAASGEHFGPPGSRPPRGFGPPVGFGPPPGSERLYGRASFERSLMRLQTDHVDLIYAHFIGSWEPLMSLMIQLKQQGKARYIGITTASVREHPQLIAAMQKHPIDFVQVDYSIANRDAATTVFPVAVARKIAIVVDMPLGGLFTSLLGQIEHRRLPPWAPELGIRSWGQYLLKYVISHPAVTCAIPGATKVEHLADDQLAGHGILPNAAERRQMEAYWDAKT